jgi:hypothetical protein
VVGGVGSHVEVAVAADVDEDHALLARLLGRLCLVEGGADRVRRLGRRDDPLAGGEAHRRLEGGVLADRLRLDHPLLDQRGETGRVPVVAQAAGVDGRRDEVVPQRVHRHQRRHADGVPEVVGVDAAGQRGAGGRLGGDEARLFALAQVGPDEGIGDAGEVGPAADAADHYVWVFPRHLHRRDRLLADHRLVQADVVEDRTERVVGVLRLRGDLDRLRDRNAEAPG